MLPFLPTKHLKHLTDSLRGKCRRFRLPRGEGSLAFTGRLLSVFRHEELAEGLCPPAAGLVETLAVFKTRSGRLLVYYIVVYPELEYLAPRQEYVRICQDAAGLRAFLGAMAYPNTWRFFERVLAEVSGTPSPAPGADRPSGAPAAPASTPSD